MELCYFHRTDLDGMCSAAIVKKVYPDCELIGVVHTDEIDWAKIETVDTVIIVDISFSEKDMEQILVKAKELIWIDHHETVKTYSMWNNNEVKGKREIGTAACKLCWQYFFPNDEIPKIVSRINDVDLWNFENEDTKPVTQWLDANIKNPEDLLPTFTLSDADYSNILEEGKTIIKINQSIIERIVKKGYPRTINGTKAFFVNSAIFTSEIGNYVVTKMDYPVAITYCDVDEEFTHFGMRSNGFNLTKIAESYGGGGHPRAAGFSLKKGKMPDK